MTTIVAADLLGYSILLARGEEDLLNRLGRVRKEVIDPELEQENARIVKTTGDGLIVEFASPVRALTCIYKLQRQIAESQIAYEPDERLQFRMGLNVGDVVVEDTDIFGDAVNVAVRLESIAPPNGICLSGAAYEQIRGKTTLGLIHLGSKHLKNIGHPVEVWGVEIDGVTYREDGSTETFSLTDQREPTPSRVAILASKSAKIDLVSKELLRDGKPVPIEPKVFDILQYLLEHRDRMVSKDELVDAIWNGRIVSDSAISSAIKSARQAIGDNGREQSVIRTVFGRGFRFVGDIETREADPRSPIGLSTNEPTKTTPAASDTAIRRTNLSRRRRALVGRDRESNHLIDSLQNHPIVSVVGPGGAGKTALAEDTGLALLGRFPGGVWLCEFAPVSESQVYSTVLGALDRSSGAGPVDSQRIAERIGDQPTLLILDNCEHVISTVARLASELSELLPALSILATSREALDVVGEAVQRIGGLDFSSCASAAVDLFRHRAAEIAELTDGTGHDDVFREIASRLEGLPLAIELAAPRLAYSNPQELLAALDDQLSVLASKRRHSSARHSTMDDTIAWSYDLLSEPERKVLLDLSVFAGAFTLEAATAVCDIPDAADLLHRLVEQSMVKYVAGKSGSRFKLLEPIRQFAERERERTPSEDLCQRHAEWFAGRVLEIAGDMSGPHGIQASASLTMEWADIGRALAWGRQLKRPDIAIDPLVALHLHLLWQLRIEGFDWLEAGVEACGLSPDRQPKTDLVRSMGSWSINDLDRSEELLEGSVASSGENVATVFFRFHQAMAREDFERVHLFAEEAVTMARELNDPFWRIPTESYLIVPRVMRNSADPDIDDMISSLEDQLRDYSWPVGKCCLLLAKITVATFRNQVDKSNNFRRELRQTADACNAPWFEITAAGVGNRQTGHPDLAFGRLETSVSNVRKAISTGDIIQMPTLLRVVTMGLYDVGDIKSAAQIIGLVPNVRGLGEKGSLAPGYNETLKLVREALPSDEFARLQLAGSRLTLEEAADFLEQSLTTARLKLSKTTND